MIPGGGGLKSACIYNYLRDVQGGGVKWTFDFKFLPPKKGFINSQFGPRKKKSVHNIAPEQKMLIYDHFEG